MPKRRRSRALLVDITRCIGCRACVGACKEAHGLPGDDTATELSATSLTAMVDQGDLHVRRLCMHCEDPSCASVCPVGALHKTDLGPVAYDARLCLGCRYCMVACPFNVPRYEWTKAVPAVRKCDMCIERVAQGQLPACVDACPVEATVAGDRDELLAEAHHRIAERPGDYHPHVYGETEAGGTSVLFLSPVPFAQLGFVQGLPAEPLPDLTWQVLEKVPGVVTLGGAALLAVWWITHRREEVAAAQTAREDDHA
ncbi:MAG: 4Fe-4S dicluster domain-containing protein [Acidobacteria bacterium]|nr:4Fe-4S dicluster domain-containing protein [Acidobacteriota bacterium]